MRKGREDRDEGGKRERKKVITVWGEGGMEEKGGEMRGREGKKGCQRT